MSIAGADYRAQMNLYSQIDYILIKISSGIAYLIIILNLRLVVYLFVPSRFTSDLAILYPF